MSIFLRRNLPTHETGQTLRPTGPGVCQLDPEKLQQAFLAILPRLKDHGRIQFRGVRDPDSRAEAISEMIAIAWKWFVRLAERGKDASKFASVLATYAARSVRSGKRLCGKEKARDVFSSVAQQRRGFAVMTMEDSGNQETDGLAEALHDNSITPVVDQVQFRLDFPRWRFTRGERDRRLIDDLMRGERTYEMTDKYGLSRARVSQLRGQFYEDWTRFCDGAPRLAAVCQ